MFWALASSVLVIYLYRTLNPPTIAAQATPSNAPPGSLQAELDALDARIASIEHKLGGTSGGGSGS